MSNGYACTYTYVCIRTVNISSVDTSNILFSGLTPHCDILCFHSSLLCKTLEVSLILFKDKTNALRGLTVFANVVWLITQKAGTL